jgi:hypothetical protein
MVVWDVCRESGGESREGEPVAIRWFPKWWHREQPVGWFEWPLVWRKDYLAVRRHRLDVLWELNGARNELAKAKDNLQKAETRIELLKAERDQIKDSYQRLVELAKAKKAIRRAQLEAYRLWFHGQRKDFLALSKRFLEISNDNGMQEKHVEDLLKGVEDAGAEQEAGRENPNRGIDHDHPGTHQGG